MSTEDTLKFKTSFYGRRLDTTLCKMSSENLQITHIKYTSKYANDVTQLFRREFFNSAAIWKEAFSTPLAYILVAVLTAIIYTYVLHSLPVSTVLAVSITSLIALLVMKGSIMCSEVYDGRKYPEKTLKLEKGMFWIMLDISQDPPQLVATIAVQPLSDAYALLTRLCVKKNYRGMGLGKRLLISALDYCERSEFQTVAAGCWHVYSFFPIREYFRTLGFVDVERRWFPSFFPMFRYWVMEKKLKIFRR